MNTTIEPQFIYPSGANVITPPSWLKQNESCKYQCGICEICGERYAWGLCQHTAYISSIDQGGHQHKKHMKDVHNMQYVIPSGWEKIS